jgi:hypothetical protein
MEILAGSFFLTVTRHMTELFVQETEKKRDERYSKDEEIA